jgi:Fic/DOC family protein
VFVAADYARHITLPGLIIRQVAGPGPLEGDFPFGYGLYHASQARALLENLGPSRSRAGLVARTLGRNAVEAKLADIVMRRGADEANSIRDLARRIAPALHAESAFEELTQMLSSMLLTHAAGAPVLRTAAGLSLAAGHPYDIGRIARLDMLASTLRGTVALANRPARAKTETAFANAAFFDSYFSNFIEGTRFTVEEARGIVLGGEFPILRPADADDILGTFRLVADRQEMQQRYTSFDGFLTSLRARHARIMDGRPEIRGGMFKDKANQAGATVFVEPDLVLGTLRQGWELLTGLQDSGARALFVMFLVAEVHPFDDGNGRAARVMMNGELLSGGQERLLVPSVYRNEYLAGLRLLTTSDDPSAYLRVMDFAHEVTHRLPFADFELTRQTLRLIHAFDEPSDDVRLLMPDALGEELTPDALRAATTSSP